MSLIDLIKFITGALCLLLGVYIFSRALKATIDGYRSDIGTDVKAYAFAVMTIILGCYLIYIAIFR